MTGRRLLRVALLDDVWNNAEHLAESLHKGDRVWRPSTSSPSRFRTG